MIYSLEILPGGDRGYCNMKCGHCVYSIRDLKKPGALRFSSQVINAVASFDQQMTQEEAKYNLIFNGSLDSDLTEYSRFQISNSVKHVVFYVGSIEKVLEDPQKVVKGVGEVIGSAIPGKPTLGLVVTDNEASFYFNSQSALKAGLGLTQAVKSSEILNARTSSHFSLIFGGNSVMDQKYNALSKNKRKMFDSIERWFKPMEEILESGAIVGVPFPIVGDGVVGASLLGISGEHRENFSVSVRYIKQSNGKLTGNRESSFRNVLLAPKGVLIDHQADSINSPEGWMMYDDFLDVLSRAKSTSLEEELNASL